MSVLNNNQSLVAGGDVRFHGEEGEGGVYPGTDEALHCCQGLHSHPDHQQEDKHQVLPGGGHRGKRDRLTEADDESV